MAASDSENSGTVTNSAQSGRTPWVEHYPANIVWDQTYEARPLYELLDGSVATYGSRNCTDFLGKRISYQEIGNLVNHTAAGLQKLGVKKDTKVGLLLPNCPTFIIYYFAILKLGGTVVNYNPLYTVEELTYQVKDSETEFMVTLDLDALFSKVETLLTQGTLTHAIICSFPALLPGAKSILFKLFKGKELARPQKSPARSKISLDADIIKNDGKFTPGEIDPVNDIAVLQYTGGTTGTPKGAMLTHANLYINVQQVLTWAPNLKRGEEIALGLLPFFHVFAMTGVMNFGLALGAELILMPRFVLDDALELIAKHKPTIMPGVPTIFNAMMSHPKIKSYDLSSLEMCLSGGAPLPLEVKRGFEAITGCTVVEAYGLSETSPAVTINPLDGAVKEGSIGQPLPATTVSLRDLTDPSKEAAPGEKGEICIKGPQVMKGYWKRPEATAETMVGDFLRTGDVGIMDEQGFIFIVDRIKDLIICSGYNVYPRRIEEALYEHPAVEECTVIGIKDDYRGEAPKAFVKLAAGATVTQEDLFEHLKDKISKIEMPVAIEFRDELPKTMIGKLSKKELQQEEAERAKS